MTARQQGHRSRHQSCSPRHDRMRWPAPAVVLAAIASVGCAGTAFAYRPLSRLPPELRPTVAARGESFVLSLTNDGGAPVYLDWHSARFVDVSTVERPPVIRSEGNIGTLPPRRRRAEAR
ncbi:MAG: hypothetical protein JW940_10160 [Polyangiaceae bacterium]|nr:hypothetical protein [Polyangiaceae bacterium]